MREVRVVWGLVAAEAVAVLVTYSRLPASQLYNITGSGLHGGLSRAVVELNFPDALSARCFSPAYRTRSSSISRSCSPSGWRTW